MMTGEQLGVGHEPRHGTAYVSSWIKALENNPKEMRAAAVDAQRISDWLISRERKRSLGDEQAEHERPAAGAGRTPEREPERPEQPAPEVGGAPAAAHVAAMQVPGGPARDSAPTGSAATPEAPAMSEELKTVLRDIGAAGYRAGDTRRRSTACTAIPTRAQGSTSRTGPDGRSGSCWSRYTATRTCAACTTTSAASMRRPSGRTQPGSRRRRSSASRRS